MQKALKITGIIFGIVLAVTAVIMFIIGGATLGTADEVVKNLVDQGYAKDVAQAAVTTSATTMFVFGAIFLVGCVLSFIAVHFSKKDDASKGALITLGVFNILFGNEVVGVISIIHGAKNGK